MADFLKPFKGVPLNQEDTETFMYAKDLLFIMIHGIMPEIEAYTQTLDRLYMNHRKLMDLTVQGRIEKSSEICNEI